MADIGNLKKTNNTDIMTEQLLCIDNAILACSVDYTIWNVIDILFIKVKSALWITTWYVVYAAGNMSMTT